jgi:hypothetical protein
VLEKIGKRLINKAGEMCLWKAVAYGLNKGSDKEKITETLILSYNEDAIHITLFERCYIKLLC